MMNPVIFGQSQAPGDRLRNAANRLQLEMWLLCECGPSLREFLSSIMRLAQRAHPIRAHKQLLS